TGLSADAVISVARRTRPAAVVLCAHRAENADATLFRRLARGRSRGRLFACGPGWQDVKLPETVEPLATLAAVVERVSYVLLGCRSRTGRSAGVVADPDPVPALPADLRAMAFRGAPIDNRALAAAATADPATRWLAAVTVGAQGRYAAAYALLEPLSVATDPVLASLACSTIGSHRRQLGGHHAARRWDARAARRGARARSDGVGTDPDGIGPTGALADALLGLAADALAVGRLAEAAALVDRAAAPARGSWRTRVRHAWVSAELVLASGRASAAVAPAERAAALAREHGAARHAVKSDIVLAVALATAGSAGERARRLALQALEAT